jgi:hypothetical protein
LQVEEQSDEIPRAERIGIVQVMQSCSLSILFKASIAFTAFTANYLPDQVRRATATIPNFSQGTII